MSCYLCKDHSCCLVRPLGRPSPADPNEGVWPRPVVGKVLEDQRPLVYGVDISADAVVQRAQFPAKMLTGIVTGHSDR